MYHLDHTKLTEHCTYSATVAALCRPVCLHSIFTRSVKISQWTVITSHCQPQKKEVIISLCSIDWSL